MSWGGSGMGRAAAVIVMALAVLGAAPVGAVGDATGPREAERRLEGVAAALDREGDRLERLVTGPRLAGADWAMDVATDLTVVEVRVWRLRVRAGEALAALLGSAAPARVVMGWLPTVPALGLAASDAVEVAAMRPVLEDWAAYRRALGRVLGLQERLGSAVAGRTTGLLPSGRTCPVDGPNDFDHTWGEERPWGREHKGEDVHAARGTPLVAIESGTIVQSGWHWEGGFGVYLEGYYSGDVYYYAHMMWMAPGIRPGAVVGVGDLLGWVGSTGNADSPHLHLGWIPDNPGRWVDLEGLADPYPLLVGLCRPG